MRIYFDGKKWVRDLRRKKWENSAKLTLSIVKNQLNFPSWLRFCLSHLHSCKFHFNWIEKKSSSEKWAQKLHTLWIDTHRKCARFFFYFNVLKKMVKRKKTAFLNGFSLDRFRVVQNAILHCVVVVIGSGRWPAYDVHSSGYSMLYISYVW